MAISDRVLENMINYRKLWLKAYLNESFAGIKVRVRGDTYLKALKNSGGILLFSHYGPFLAMFDYLKREQGLRFDEITGGELNKYINKAYKKQEGSGETIPADSAYIIGEILDRIKQKGIVAMSGDFSEQGKLSRHQNIVRFMGNNYLAPIGINFFLRKTNVPVISVNTFVHEGVINILISDVRKTGYPKKYFSDLETLICKFPSQWFGAHVYARVVTNKGR